MNVKSVSIIAAVLLFLFFAHSSSLRADEAVTGGSYVDNCPEYATLKNRKASIGGNAWNYYTQWIYNRFTGGDNKPYGVYKKAEKIGGTDASVGNEIYGWSRPQWPDNIMEDPEHGLICWGETCEGPPLKDSYDTLDLRTFLDGNDGLPRGRNDSFARLDFDNREPMCHEVVDRNEDGIEDGIYEPHYRGSGGNREPVYKPCEMMDNKEKYEEMRKSKESDSGKIPAYCIYPLKGWMKIRGLGDNGWTRLSGRIFGDNVPKEKRDDKWNITGIQPGHFGTWPLLDKLNCSNDAVFSANKMACSYRVAYDPRKKEFYGWAWNPFVEWISFSGSTLYDTREWDNKTWCDGPSCTEVNYDQNSKRSRWNTAYLGVWVKGIGGNLFSRKGFSGVNPPPGEFNTDYLLVTGRYGDKQGSVDTWEGACDDPRLAVRSGCPPLADIFEQKRKKPPITSQETSQEIFDLRPPTASQRVNRSAIKRGSLGSLNGDALFPKPTDPPQQAGPALKNAYGNNVKIIQSESDVFGQSIYDPIILNNTIYYHDGDLEIGANDNRGRRELLNGITGSGAGTIVVRGNLTIKRPIEYQQASALGLTNFHQLASLSWVVLNRDTPALHGESPIEGILDDEWRAGGNVVIDKCIPGHIDSKEGMGTGTPDYEYNMKLEYKKDAAGNLVLENGKKVLVPENPTETAAVNKIFENQQFTVVSGSFFVENIFATGEGRGGANASGGECPNLKIKYWTTTEVSDLDDQGRQQYDAVGNEKKKIGEAVLNELYYDLPLEIRGVVVAKKMLLQRVYRGVNRGSETIVNTGRALVNPSPGIAEFARSLPLW
ncbi:hypothetical protein HY623_04495 [Candidatus Uhrbacteria bacterium]|nr:hypothetical protein [Candidatus Uhrbacteria bacterium]